MLYDAYLFGNHIELLAGVDTDLNQRMAVVRAEWVRLGHFVLHDLARQIRIQRFASALATCVPCNLRGGFVLPRGRGVSTECFRLGKQAELVSRARLARRAEPLLL
jgi:hypothetical protein